MMKHTILFFSLVISLTGCRSARNAAQVVPENTPAVETAPAQVDYYEQSTWLLGFFGPERMKREPHAAWYFKGYDSYVPKPEAIEILADIPTDDLSIKVVMGTWCPDSRREVPRFMKILDAWRFPEDKVTFTGVDVNKISPTGDYQMLNIERVPTFIFYKNNIEAGRIIEVPKTSLEQDMINILTGMNKNN